MSSDILRKEAVVDETATESLEAISSALEEIDEMDGKYLTFFTDGQRFAIPIRDVMQIIGMQEITPIPHFPTYAKGIINLRGNIIPLIDVRIRMEKPETAYTERTCIIVADIRGLSFGFIVDEVDEVTEIDPEFVSKPPNISEDAENRYLTGIARMEEKIVLLLDAAKILHESEFEALASTAQKETH